MSFTEVITTTNVVQEVVLTVNDIKTLFTSNGLSLSAGATISVLVYSNPNSSSPTTVVQQIPTSGNLSVVVFSATTTDISIVPPPP